MRLLSLSLEQFRNYPLLQMDLSGADRHLFIGPNGSGKTNIIEAISVLSLTKSALGVDEDYLRQWDSGHFRVRGTVESDAKEEKTLEVVSQVLPRRQKGCFVNDVRVSLSDMVGQLPMVLFLPQDLQLFSGPPAERRRFIDQLLCQVSPSYFQSLTTYQKLLKQRNALLKSIAQRTAQVESLEIWDTALAEQASRITVARLELMEAMNLSLTTELQTLGERWTDVRIVFERATLSRDRAELEAELLQTYQRMRDRDILLQTTGAGPHRDDWRIDIDGHPIASFASRGQQRVSVLALLFLEASFVELQRNERPVILLDDVFSELDDHHQEGVLRAFSAHQVFITGTHLPSGMGEATVWNVWEGTVGRA